MQFAPIDWQYWKATARHVSGYMQRVLQGWSGAVPGELGLLHCPKLLDIRPSESLDITLWGGIYSCEDDCQLRLSIAPLLWVVCKYFEACPLE